jgi:hypothetical protein
MMSLCKRLEVSGEKLLGVGGTERLLDLLESSRVEEQCIGILGLAATVPGGLLPMPDPSRAMRGPQCVRPVDWATELVARRLRVSRSPQARAYCASILILSRECESDERLTRVLSAQHEGDAVVEGLIARERHAESLSRYISEVGTSVNANARTCWALRVAAVTRSAEVWPVIERHFGKLQREGLEALVLEVIWESNSSRAEEWLEHNIEKMTAEGKAWIVWRTSERLWRTPLRVVEGALRGMPLTESWSIGVVRRWIAATRTAIIAESDRRACINVVRSRVARLRDGRWNDVREELQLAWDESLK